MDLKKENLDRDEIYELGKKYSFLEEAKELEDFKFFETNLKDLFIEIDEEIKNKIKTLSGI
jgi:hypothetical protein